MVIATGDMDYPAAVLRARDIDALDRHDRDRVLEHLAARYPEAVAAVLEDLTIPKALELRARQDAREEVQRARLELARMTA